MLYDTSFTYQFFLNSFDHLSCFLNTFLLASDGDDVAVATFRWQIDLGVGLVTDLTDVGTSLADDVLVELLEDVDLTLVVAHDLHKRRSFFYTLSWTFRTQISMETFHSYINLII